MIKPVQKRTFVYGAALALTVGSIGVGVSALRGTAAEQPMVEIPIFEVDPLWPKPLPEEALLGMTIGVSVDAQDNVWIVHRGACDAEQQRERLHAQSAGLDLLQVGAAGDRIQPGWRRRARLGRPRTGLRVAGVDARGPCRLQGRCLARR